MGNKIALVCGVTRTPAASQHSAQVSIRSYGVDIRGAAQVVAFLASANASWIHGQIIQPNGGLI